MIGDNGRRGQSQNLPAGWPATARPTTSSAAPRPITTTSPASILRLNPDGTAPTDNPFAGVTAQVAQLEQHSASS